MKQILCAVIAAALLTAGGEVVRSESPAEMSAWLAAIRQVGPDGAGHREAAAAWRKLSAVGVARLPDVLAAMDDANPLAMNWLRAAADAIAERAVQGGEQLPQLALEQFVSDRSHNPRARRWAFERLERADPALRERLIPTMLDDPSLELRRDAVAVALGKAQALQVEGKKADAIDAFRTALTAARDQDQIEAAAKALSDLGAAVDLPTHFGFLTRWMLIGPFDNTAQTGFDAVFPPEEKIDLAVEHQGKAGKVRWFEYATADDYGMVDLNQAIGKYNGVTAYAYAPFFAPEARDIELRLGSINANKVWLNGKLLTANEVYHTNTTLDQYTGRGRLNKGVNHILVKICQNEQTEDWAQRWQFQLRVCDELGTAVRSQEAAR